MGLFGSIGKALKKIAPIGLGVVGNAILPGIGGVAGGALGGAIAGKGTSAGLLGGAAAGGLGGLAANAASGGKGFSLGGLAKSGLAGLKNDPAKIAQLGLAGLSTVQGAKKQGQADEVTKKLLAQLDAQAAAQGEARKMALARLGQPMPTAPNLARLTASSNPFAR
jgi:hypothetical protein